MPCAQEYKWRELEEQRQAQKLQKQLQQEQAYLLQLQHHQKPDGGAEQQQEQLQTTEAATAVRPAQSRSLEKRAAVKSDQPQGPAPESERIREVTPPPRFLLLVSPAGWLLVWGA